MPIREAVLDDVDAIRNLFITSIGRWQRMTDDGRVEDLPYEALTIYERWLHGGAWMTLETGSLWLSHLASGAGIALVHVEDDDITAYIEAYLSREAPPFGNHLHIAQLVGDVSHQEALLNSLSETIEAVERITVASTVYDEAKLKFYRGFGFMELSQMQLVNLSAKGTAVGFYKVTEWENADAAQIETWQMPIGRLESARYHWEQLWAQLWHAIPEIMQRRIHRLRFNAGGQDAYVVVREQLYNPRSAEIFCWTPKPLSSHLVGGIRDWCYKTGYRNLTMAVNEKLAQTLDMDFEQTAHQNVILARKL